MIYQHPGSFRTPAKCAATANSSKFNDHVGIFVDKIPVK